MQNESKDFVINSDGSVTRKNYTPVEQTAEDKLEAEYNQLVYDMSHPERFSADEMAQKSQRRAELHSILGKDKFITVKNGKFMDAAARMREKLRAQLLQNNQSKPSLSDIVQQSKQNG